MSEAIRISDFGEKSRFFALSGGSHHPDVLRENDISPICIRTLINYFLKIANISPGRDNVIDLFAINLFNNIGLTKGCKLG